MAKYRKKPVVVEAWRIDAENEDELGELAQRLAMENAEHDFIVCYEAGNFTGVLVETLEGEMCGGIGDWLIRGVAGEFYPCKPDIFQQTYEAVE